MPPETRPELRPDPGHDPRGGTADSSGPSPADASSPPDAPGDGGAGGAEVIAVPARAHRLRAWLILAVAAWTAYVWLTRLGIVLDGAQTVGFRVVHAVLIVISLVSAVALAVVGWRMRTEARRANPEPPGGAR